MKAIILAGGFGTRLRSITNDLVPKCLVQIMDKPLVSHIIHAMNEQGITDITLALHYKAEQFREYFGNSIKYAIEDEPLGTGGAIKNALRTFTAEELREPVLVVNGDTIADIQYSELSKRHIAQITVATTYEGESAGIYLIDPDLFNEFPDRTYSFEREIIPKVPHTFYHIPWFTDAGTPDGYEKACNGK